MIYTIPDYTIFDRYHNNIKLNLILNYHCKLASKSKYYVSVFDNEKGYTNGYYTTDNKDNIHHDNGYMLKDCTWDATKWHDTPFITYITPLHKSIREEFYHERTTPLFERGYNGDLIAVRINNDWQFKTVSIKKQAYTSYLTYDFTYDKITINTVKSGRFSVYVDKKEYYEHIGGLGTADTVQVKKLDNSQYDAIKWFIEALQSKKFKGFYDDVIERLKQI